MGNLSIFKEFIIFEISEGLGIGRGGFIGLLIYYYFRVMKR